MLSSCVSPPTTKTANIKRRYYLAAHCRVVNVLTSNSAFLISVCLSATSLYCIETSRRIELGFFCLGASSDLSYTVLLGKSGTPKNKGTSLWNFAANSGLGKFRHGESMMWSTKLVGVRGCGLHLYDGRARRNWNAQSLLHVGTHIL